MIYVQLCLWIILTVLWYCRMCQSKWREDSQKFTAMMDNLRAQAEKLHVS
jgi:hypothetical protein